MIVWKLDGNNKRTQAICDDQANPADNADNADDINGPSGSTLSRARGKLDILCSVEDGCGKNMASHHFGYPYVRCLVSCVNEPKKETLQVAMHPDGKYLWYIYMKWCGWEAMMLQLSRRNCSLWKSTRPGRQFTGSTKTMTWYNGNQNLSYGVMMRMECMAYTYICKFQCWL